MTWKEPNQHIMVRTVFVSKALKPVPQSSITVHHSKHICESLCNAGFITMHLKSTLTQSQIWCPAPTISD